MTRPSMGLYEWMPAIKSIATNTNAVTATETISDFRYDIRKRIDLYHDLVLKKVHLILASDKSPRGLRDEVVRVR